MSIANRHPIPAVGALIIRDQQILLIRRGKAPNKDQWSVPGGAIEWGETLEMALEREIREEIQVAINVGPLAGVKEVITHQDGEIPYHYISIDYFADILAGTPEAASDAAEVRWVSLGDLHTLDVTPTLWELLGELGLLV